MPLTAFWPSSTLLNQVGIVFHPSDVGCCHPIICILQDISPLGFAFIPGILRCTFSQKILLCGTDSRAFAFEQADSIVSTNICNIWLCRHVYRPCARAYLQLDKACRSVWTSPQSAHLESSTIPYFRRLSREGSWSYRHLITKDSRSGGMLHMSFHEIGLCRASSHVVHCPCWPCCTAFVILTFSILLFLSWMINADL